MGDSRATIKIQFDIYQEHFKADWWINYWPNSEGIDGRVVEWFADRYREARDKWDEEYLESCRAEEKKRRREAYLELKAEFDEEG